MPRPSVGTVAQASSRTALFAFVASRLEAVSARARDDYCRHELRIAVTKNGLERAAQPYLSENVGPGTQGHEGTIRGWVLVQEPVVDVDRAFVRLPGKGVRR